VQRQRRGTKSLPTIGGEIVKWAVGGKGLPAKLLNCANGVLDRLAGEKISKMNGLGFRFSVAPMMHWTD
jgi:hypothetical protein